MALENLRGRVAFIFEEVNFDVDQIVGVKNIKITDIDELADAAMQSYDPDFRSSVRPGDLIVGADNFGYGHPHYPPMRAMRHIGVAGVLAESFFTWLLARRNLHGVSAGHLPRHSRAGGAMGRNRDRLDG